MPTLITRRRFWLLAAPLVLTLLALAALTAIPASAQTDRYVDPAGACAGNSNCYTTIGAAVAASGPGDTIYVFPGTYAESVNLSRMATPGDITFIAVDTLGTPTPGAVTVDPGAPGGPGWRSAFRNSAWPFPGHVTINGFIVKSPTADGIFLVVNGDVVIVNVTANGVGDGIDVDGSGDDGVDIKTQTGNITVSHCTANNNFGTFGDGFDLQTVVGNVTIAGCTANDNRGTDDNQGYEVERVGGNLIISDTVANGNDDDGFWICCVEGNLTFNGCTADDTHDGEGFDIWSVGGDATFSHSTANGNSLDGLWLGNVGGDVSINLSTAVGNGDDGFDVTQVAGEVTISDFQCPPEHLAGLLGRCYGENNHC